MQYPPQKQESQEKVSILEVCNFRVYDSNTFGNLMVARTDSLFFLCVPVSCLFAPRREKWWNKYQGEEESGKHSGYWWQDPPDYLSGLPVGVTVCLSCRRRPLGGRVRLQLGNTWPASPSLQSAEEAWLPPETHQATPERAKRTREIDLVGQKRQRSWTRTIEGLELTTLQAAGNASSQWAQVCRDCEQHWISGSNWGCYSHQRITGAGGR